MAVLTQTFEFEAVEFDEIYPRYWKVRRTVCIDCPADPVRACSEWIEVSTLEVLNDTS